ncbi:hypothetical protein Tco_0210985 [Tanacetum coccineum]
MDDPNITMEEYIRVEEEKARRHGQTFNWQTATYGKMEYYEDEDDSSTNLETEYPAIVFDGTALSCEPTVSPLNNDEINFRISFDESDNEDYMLIFVENSFSYKIICIDTLKTDSENENDKVNMLSSLPPEPTIGYIEDLDFFKDFENEFPAIVYNDLKSKSDPLIEPSISSQHIDKFETSLSEYDEEEQNVLYFNESFPLDVIFPNNLKTIKDNDDNIDITQPSRKAKMWHLYHLGIRGTHGSDTRSRDMTMVLYTATSRGSRQYGVGRLTGMSDTEMGLDVADTLCFKLGGARRRMTWRQFILALGLHTKEEMVKAGFGAYCMDRGTANVLYLLAQYLFRHAEGRKSRARLFGCPSLGVLQLILDWLVIRVRDTWAWVAPGPKKQQAAAVGAPRAAKDTLVVDEGAQVVPAPVQAP